MYLRPHLSRALSLSLYLPDRTSFTRRAFPSLISAPRAFRTGPSSSLSFLPAREPRPFSLQRFNSRAISLPVSLLILPSLSRTHSFPRSRYPAFSIGVPPLGPVAFFFRRTSFFPQHAPGPSSDFYNLLLVARHTPPTVASSAAAAAAVCPARPTRKNRKIEENKSDRRATARRASRGVYSGGGGGNGNGNGGGSYGGGR